MYDSYDRAQLIRAVHEATTKATNMTLDGTAFVVKAVFAELLNGMEKSRSVKIKDFGTIKIRTAAPIARQSAPGSFARGKMINVPTRARFNIKLSPDIQARMNKSVQE